jgi:hypothetical protein
MNCHIKLSWQTHIPQLVQNLFGTTAIMAAIPRQLTLFIKLQCEGLCMQQDVSPLDNVATDKAI